MGSYTLRSKGIQALSGSLVLYSYDEAKMKWLLFPTEKKDFEVGVKGGDSLTILRKKKQRTLIS